MPEKKSSEPFHETGTQEAEVVAAINEMKAEARDAKVTRIKQNKFNWDIFHGRGRTLHKRKGQSREFLHKSALAAEQITSLFKQSLVNFDKWIDVEWIGEEKPDDLFTPHVAKSLLRLYLDRADIKAVISDAIKVGLHEGLCTVKLTGRMAVVPRYASSGGSLRRKEKREWRLMVDVLSAEEYFPDPHPGPEGKLYEIHQMVMDRSTALDYASTEGKEAERPLWEDRVLQLQMMEGADESESRKARNRGDLIYRARTQRRHPVLIDDFYGTLLDRSGKVMVWKGEDGKETELRNVHAVVGNERILVLPPESNPRWAATSPFISAPILRVPFAAWPKAVMDAAASLNITLNELFNLMLDGGLSAVHGIKQLHENWLTPETLEEISDHIPPGTTLGVNPLCPTGGKALERVDSGDVPADVMAFFNVVNQLFAENALSNEIKLGGMPQKQVRATEVMASQQAISGIFDGISSDFEDVFVEKLAEEAWYDILQNVDKFPVRDLARLIGEEKVKAINALSPAQRFERAGSGFKWKGKGIRTITQRMRDFQKLVQFLSVVGQNELLLQEFTMRFSMPRMLSKFMSSLEIDPEEIELNDQERQAAQMRKAMQEKAMAAAMGAQEGAQPPGPGRQPEIPQEGGEEAMEPGVEMGSGQGVM